MVSCHKTASYNFKFYATWKCNSLPEWINWQYKPNIRSNRTLLPSDTYYFLILNSKSLQMHMYKLNICYLHYSKDYVLMQIYSIFWMLIFHVVHIILLVFELLIVLVYDASIMLLVPLHTRLFRIYDREFWNIQN